MRIDDARSCLGRGLRRFARAGAGAHSDGAGSDACPPPRGEQPVPQPRHLPRRLSRRRRRCRQVQPRRRRGAPPPPGASAAEAAGRQAARNPSEPGHDQVRARRHAKPSGRIARRPAAGRYHFTRVDDGYPAPRPQIRPGRLLQHAHAGWSCEAVPENRASLEKQIDDLRAEVTAAKSEIDALKQEIASLRAPPPPPPHPVPPQTVPPSPPPGERTGGITLKLPSHEDIARARGFIADTWHRLVEMIEHMQKDLLRRKRRRQRGVADVSRHGRPAFIRPRGEPAGHRQRDAARRNARRRLHRDHRAGDKPSSPRPGPATARCWSICATPRPRSPSRRTPTPTCRPI